MGIFAALGVSQAFWFFTCGAMFAVLSYFASKTLQYVRSCLIISFVNPCVDSREAIERVMHAPMSFFETTVSSFAKQAFDKLTVSIILFSLWEES